MTDRATLAAGFLAAAGWGGAVRHPLAGDASARRYERLARGSETAILMDSPPGQADDPADFLRIGEHLRGIGLSAPETLASDLGAGFLLIEDFGDGVFARLVAEEPARELPLYEVAVDVLVRLQAHPAPMGLSDLSAADWAGAAELVLTDYAHAATGEVAEAAGLTEVLAEVLARHADGPRVLILRDYHAENLMWLPEREGVRRAGLLDFQLGQMGQPGYDLVSLLQDARRDVSPATEAAMTRRFAEAAGLDGLETRLAVLGAQRALRIMGIFARLCVQGGKPGYLALMPRVWRQLQRNLSHPALARLAEACERLLPPPTEAVRERIRRCGR